MLSGVKSTTKPAKAKIKELSDKYKKAKAKSYGEKGSYSRVDDMKRSEFYRDRHNSGKSFSGSDDAYKKNILKIQAGLLGAGGAGIAYENYKSSNKKYKSSNKK